MSKAPAVDYALKIIEFFASTNQEIGIADISNALGINKNAVTRVLEALLEKNWIYLSDGFQKKYRLTLRPFSVIAGHVRGMGLTQIAAPYVEKLNQELGDSVYFGVKQGKNVMYLLHCDSVREVRINGCAGGEYPLGCSAPGKVLLSNSEEGEIRDYFDTPIEKRTPNTITDFDRFMLEAERIKKAGYAIDNEEFAKGIICIAVPVYDHTGSVAAAMGISSLTLYDDLDSLRNKKLSCLRKAAEACSASLGYCKEEGVSCE